MNHDIDLSALATATTATAYGNDAQSILDSIMELQRELAKRPAIDVNLKPDRNGNVYPSSISGMQITVSDMLPTTKQIAHMRERKWSHRKRFQKERRFNITYETKPNNDVYILADKIVMNPRQYDAVCAGIPASNSPVAYSMGMGVGVPDYIPMETPRREFMFDFNIRPQSVALIRGGI